MPVRIPKTVAKYLNHQVGLRLGLLEKALLELHDLDNRMKMELLALTSMLKGGDGILDFEDDHEFAESSVIVSLVLSVQFNLALCTMNE